MRKGEQHMGKRPGAKYVALQRLDALMAENVTHAPAPLQTALEAFTFPDGHIHTFEMRTYCQHVVMDFLTWCRDAQDTRNHAEIEASADELVWLFLGEQKMQGQSPETALQAKRS